MKEATTKDCMQVLDEIYQLALTNDNIFGAVRFVTDDQNLLAALDILVFNGYLTFTDDMQVKITTEGIGARINGFGNATKIYEQL